jgi:hypothetical protein
VIQIVAESMRAQAAGDFLAAWRQLLDATRLLPASLRRTAPAGGGDRAVLTTAPLGGSAVARWTWRMSLVVWREQNELDDLRQRFACGRQKARAELIEAYIHYMIWVEFDYWAWYRHTMRPELPRDDGICVEVRRTELLLRASHLRQFASPTSGDVSEAVWKDLGGQRGLRAEALRSLATQKRVPWQCPDADQAVRVRPARQEAWEYAGRWFRRVIEDFSIGAPGG